MRICIVIFALLASNALAATADLATKPTTQSDDKEGLVIEQEVTMEMPELKIPPQKTVLKCKGLKMRIDTGSMASVIVFEDGRTATIIHLTHSYLIQTRSQAKEAAQRTAIQRADISQPSTPTPTGNHMKIRGYDADEYTYESTSPKSQTSKVTVWIATDFPDGGRILAQLRAFRESNEAMKLRADVMSGPNPKEYPNGITIRTETDMPNGGKMIVDVVSAKFAPVEDSEFELPKGYQEQDMPTLPTGQ